MTKGPKINYSNRNFTTRDNLGINAAGTTFQAELSPVINTVTPRAFYWVFAVWNYYDYWQNYKTRERSVGDFEQNFLKRNDYFFVLANLMTDGSDRDNLVGKENCRADSKLKGPFPFNRKYFRSSYGGMQYYIPGCFSLGLVTSTDNEGNKLSFPKITEKKGVPIAVAFENVIKDTEYYKRYRLNDIPVPKPVLEELGRAISLSMEGMDECKALLREVLFQPTKNILFNNEKLIQSKDYLLFTNEKYGIKYYNSAQMRRVLFDYFCPGGEHEEELPPELHDIATAWEVAMGRQYFTLSLELIWKYMLLELTTPMFLERWIEQCFVDSKWTVDLHAELKTIADKAKFDFEEREKRITTGYRNSSDVSRNIENALLIMLSVCNRFKGRNDITQEQLAVGTPVSVADMIREVQNYQDKPIADFLAFIMSEWILRRHEQVAFGKMMEGRDGYFIERVDNRYYHKVDSSPDFAGNRMMQLKSVMADLDMLV